jgi:signal transduction histidine kinase
MGWGKSRTGYIVTSLNVAQSIEPILGDRSGLGRTGQIYLLSRDGRYLAAPPGNSGLTGKKHLRSGHFISGKEGMPDHGSTVQEYQNDRGFMVLGAAKRLPVLHWTIVGEIHQAEAFAWLHTLRKRALITGAVTLIIVLVLAGISSKTLSRPLREMAAVSRKIAKGYHEERLSAFSGAEAREVSRAFNKMLDRLAASHRRLQHAASLAVVGELSSSIVHEIRNPLSSIKLNLQALHRKVENDRAHAELADIAMTQVARLEKMLTGLLNYGKPLDLQLGRTNAGELVRDAVELARKEREEKQVSIEIEDHAGQNILIADAEQIRRALTNLVVNAVQVAPKSGKVLITAPSVRDMTALDYEEQCAVHLESDRKFFLGNYEVYNHKFCKFHNPPAPTPSSCLW